jgi:DNA replication protein DnaC
MITEEQKARDLAIQREINEEARQARIEARRKHTWIWLGEGYSEESLARLNFTNFETSAQPAAYMAAIAFAANPTGTLILEGASGTGKTHLLSAIANEVSGRQKLVRYAKLYRMMERCYSLLKEEGEYHGLTFQAASADLLLLDEADKGSDHEFFSRVLLSIIDARWQARLPIAIATNSLDRLSQLFTGPGMSRIMHKSVYIKMLAKDFRRDPRCL